jgi:hypothetical protein
MEAAKQMLLDSGRKLETDKKFETDEANVGFPNHLFLRLVAKDKSFTKVDFKYTIFDACYIRGCKFDSCDFTGCRFVGTNLHGSKFSGCKFDYATFERTSIDSDILDTECPGLENLKLRFARTLRMNYQQLGDAAAANRAMMIELEASEAHLHKAWRSKESYYRKKYYGWHRLQSFLEWLKFKLLDVIWGNGEHPLRLLRSVLVVLFAMTIFEVVSYGDPQRLDSYITALESSPEIFLGVLTPPRYETWYLTTVTLVRLVAIGFLLSIIIKKFNRR